MLDLNRKAARDALAQLVGEDGLLNGAKVKLFTTGVVVDMDSELPLPEASFDGYAASAAVTWGTPRNEGADVVVEANRVQFTATSDEGAQQIAGYYLVSGDVTPVLLGVEVFDAPVSISKEGDAVSVIPKVKLKRQAS